MFEFAEGISPAITAEESANAATMREAKDFLIEEFIRVPTKSKLNWMIFSLEQAPGIRKRE
jgi:hypothetical protein